MIRSRTLGVAAAALAAASTAGAVAFAAPAPRVAQLIVFRNGSARSSTVAAGQSSVRLGLKRCTVPGGSALSALVRSRAPRLALHDYASCTGRARDSAGLFVQGIGGDRNRGQDGWVYKVGSRLATAGAADSAGPFGRGLLRSGARVVWFYCHMDARTHSCQPTLDLSAQVAGPGSAVISVRAYDDRGRAVSVAGAIIRSGSSSKRVSSDGRATLSLPRGRQRLHAEQSGAIRSFDAGLSIP